MLTQAMVMTHKGRQQILRDFWALCRQISLKFDPLPFQIADVLNGWSLKPFIQEFLKNSDWRNQTALNLYGQDSLRIVQKFRCRLLWTVSVFQTKKGISDQSANLRILFLPILFTNISKFQQLKRKKKSFLNFPACF